LLAAGAELEASTPAGTTPVAAALQGGHHQVALMLVQADVSGLSPCVVSLNKLRSAAVADIVSSSPLSIDSREEPMFAFWVVAMQRTHHLHAWLHPTSMHLPVVALMHAGVSPEA
jgi:hypothetical protein